MKSKNTKSYSLFNSSLPRMSGPIKNTQSDYDFLNRSDRTEDIRKRLDRLFKKYCMVASEKDSKHLKNRFRSKKNSHHLAALTELIVFKILSENSEDLNIENYLHNTSKKPDFKTTLANGKVIINEVTSILDSGKLAAYSKYDNEIKDVVDNIKNKGFIIDIEIYTRSKKKPDLKNFRTFVENKLYEFGDKESVYECKWCSEEWVIYLNIRKAGHEKTRNIVSLYDHNMEYIQNDKILFDTIHKKGKKYKNTNNPFILWVNIATPDTDFIDDNDISSALYGDTCEGVSSSLKWRNHDGIFTNGGTCSKRLSAVVVFNKLNAYNFESVEKSLWLNQNADYSVPDEFRPIRTVMLKKNGIEVTEI